MRSFELSSRHKTKHKLNDLNKTNTFNLFKWSLINSGFIVKKSFIEKFCDELVIIRFETIPFPKYTIF